MKLNDFWKRFSRNRSAVLGLLILSLVILVASIAGFIYPEDPFLYSRFPLSSPGVNGFLLGSDSIGRDVASGIAHGAKTSLMIGLIATLAAVFIGVIFGAFAGYYGGLVDDILMRVTEVFQTIPSFIFAILLVAIMKPSIESVVIAITVVSWPAVARLVRGEFLSLKNREFVQACHTLGMSDYRIMLNEILPNCLSPIIVIGSLMVATAILIESGLAFLGLGDPNVMSWGFQISDG
ncbi:MAG: ABC transporter permease, partial [Planktomarina sp.]|nr:ABC transporter permease [Planktomarina sp.]